MSKETGALRQTDASRALPSVSGSNITPRYLRELVRIQYAESNLKRLHDIAMGEATFSIPVAIPPGKGEPGRVEMVDAEAPAMVQAIAAKALVEVAIPKQMGLVDGDDKGFTGIIELPARDAVEPDDAEYEIVEEDVRPDNAGMSEDRDVAPPPLDKGTVPPEYVQRVLAKYRNGKNGKS